MKKMKKKLKKCAKKVFFIASDISRRIFPGISPMVPPKMFLGNPLESPAEISPEMLALL